MTDEKGLDGAIADRIGEYVKYKGGPELLAQLEADATLTTNKSATQGLADMKILFSLLRAYDLLERVCLFPITPGMKLKNTDFI
jgi:histidyl-tRNA synthetase